MDARTDRDALMTHFRDPREIYSPAANNARIALIIKMLRARREDAFSLIEEKYASNLMRVRTLRSYSLDCRAIMSAN